MNEWDANNVIITGSADGIVRVRNVSLSLKLSFFCISQGRVLVPSHNDLMNLCFKPPLEFLIV